MSEGRAAPEEGSLHPQEGFLQSQEGSLQLQEGASQSQMIRTTRSRMMTEKGVAYQTDIRDNKRRDAYRRLAQKGNHINKMIVDEESAKEIQLAYSHWLTLYEMFLDSNDDYLELLTEEEKHLDTWLGNRSGDIDRFRAEVEAVCNAKAEVQQKFKSESDLREHLETRSHASRSSHGSKVSNVSSARIKEEQRKAELKVKTQALQKRKQLAQAKLNLELEAEQLELEEQLAITDARSKILDEIEERRSMMSFKPVVSPFIQKRLDDDLSSTTRPWKPDPKVPEFVPHSMVKTKLESNDHGNDMIMSVVKHLRKPVVEIAKFNGDPIKYRKFIRQFNARIINNTDDDDEKMTYLEQLTTGEANKIVLSFSHLDAAFGYKAVLRELEERYGDNEVIATSYIKKALNWPNLKANDSKGLDEFSVFLVECENAVRSINSMKILEYPDTLRKLVSKLPFHLHDRWRNLVLQTKDNFQSINFQTLVSFVKKEARKANHPIFGREIMAGETAAQSIKGQKLQRPKGSYAGMSEDIQHIESKSSIVPDKSSHSSSQRQCLYCDENTHSLDWCHKFKLLPFSDKINFIRSKGLCFGCLRSGHMKSKCLKKSTCRVCKRKHLTVLHIDNYRPQGVKSEEKSSASESVSEPEVKSNVSTLSGECTFAIIPVRVRMANHVKEVETYAFLDPGSNVSFCSERLMYQISGSRMHHQRRKITVDTMGVPHVMNTNIIKGMEITDLESQNVVKLPEVYTKDRIPATIKNVPKEEDISRWPHLDGIHLPQIDATVDLLIGNNTPDAYSPLDVRVGPSGTPHAAKTRLGWVVWNLVRDGDPHSLSVNRAEITAIQNMEQDKKLEHLMQKFLNMEFPEKTIEDKKEASVEDKLFMTKITNSMQVKDGHYEMCLPLRDDRTLLPNNSAQALQRLGSLKRKLEKNDLLHCDYTAFMESIINKGYAEPVPVSELQKDNGMVWYIPHHGVYHPHKPDKIRVVFDCASLYRGVSLNQLLLQGPDLTSSLLGVLLRFRQESVAVMGDIESMFYQVRVSQDHIDYLRFFWWPKGILSENPVEHRMLVHLFGAASSPACSNVALQRTADDNRHLFSSDVCDAVSRNFYVDDLLISVSSVEKAISLVQDITDLCSKGGFHLTKWSSNSRTVMKSLPSEELAMQLRQLDLDGSDLPMERALGVGWHVETDQFHFSIHVINHSTVTRRTILSVVGSIFDPLGLVSPFVLHAKVLLQDLCRRAIPWDEELTGEDLQKWQRWLTDLCRLDQFGVSRCVKPHDFGDVVSCQIHHFSDASDTGYGVTTYVRLVNSDGKVHCALLLSRARVNPLKKMTIPRLELTAATAAVRLHQTVVRQLDYDIHDVYYWTDSMSVLRYIWNETTRFYTFVANRVSLIRESTELHQWRFVPSILNPADDVSRGLTVQGLLESERWQNGPQFLWLNETEWPKQPETKFIPEGDSEVKKQINVVLLDDRHSLDRLMSYFSSWMKLKKTVAWLLVARRCLMSWTDHRKKLQEQIGKQESDESKRDVIVENAMKQMKMTALKEGQKNLIDISLSVAMLEEAEMIICQLEQQKYFSKEIDILSEGSFLQKNSPLYKLDPVIQNGILRVGGRLDKAAVPYDAKHQIILPAHSPVSRLILLSAHESVGHLGLNSILSEVRQRFWIVSASTVIKQLLSQCVVCRRYQAKCLEQKMADLPEDRTVAGEPPFTRVGVDYFGPLEVKRGRSSVKRYGVIFTCLSTRAVHLEVANGLDTDSCINAIRRFISRRGPVKVIRSDNGTNLVGAEKELRLEINTWNESKIHSSLLQKGIDWTFNPPTASHFGGVWERMIRTARKVLYTLIKQQMVKLDDDALITLFCEVEAILNSRPITKTSTDPDDLEAITPNHLLLLKPGPQLPCGIFSKEDNYARRRWRHVQFLADMFWTRWSKEYLVTLQERQKWIKPKRNIAIDDIVLLADSTPRNSWALGRVTEVIPDQKGLVRVVWVKTKSNILRRPIHKLCVILEADAE